MKNKIKRAVISVVVFAVIYILSGFIIGWHSYDMYLKAIEFLAAIIGAGFYWIGSNEQNIPVFSSALYRRTYHNFKNLQRSRSFMRLQSAIFDMDGTLLDSMPTWRELGPSFLKEQGIPVTPEQLHTLRTMTDHEVIPYLQETCGLEMTTEQIMDEIIRRMEDFYTHRVRSKPGLEKFLSILKMEGVWMYVATATHRRLAEKALKTAGIDHYFRGIVTSAEAGTHKRDSADIYEMAMRRLQSNKRDTVVFEDALHAIRTAKAAGFRVAGVYEATAEQDQPEIQRLCDYYIRSYEELVQSETF